MPGVTRLRGVELGVSDDGIATPVAVVDPIPLADRTITRATFRNGAFLQENDVRIGDALTLRASNGSAVVDAILPLLRTGQEEALRVPSECPVCGCDLRHMGDDIVCPNASCPPQLPVRVRRLVSADGFAIPELDDAAIDDLISARAIESPADVFRLREVTLRRLGWDDARLRSLTDSIDRARRVPLERLLSATSGIDRNAAVSIAEHARTLARVKRLATGSLARLPGVGTRAAEAVANFMREPRNRKMLAQIARAGVTTLRVGVHDAP